jgi:dTDP-4-dehydrorhamnose 3,5-epimerase
MQDGRPLEGEKQPAPGFQESPIKGVLWKPLQTYHDKRGWLCELFRHDELAREFHPEMAYASVTEPGVARGPHEHVEQADLFCFFGPSNFMLYLKDNRPHSPTYLVAQKERVGADRPMVVIIPPGVVHAYRNVGDVPGLVFNCPNRLYKGPGRQHPIDEIRHEDDPASPFRLEQWS